MERRMSIKESCNIHEKGRRKQERDGNERERKGVLRGSLWKAGGL